MLAEIFTIIAPVLFIALIGFAWDKRGLPFDTTMVAGLVTNIGAPCLILSTMLDSRPDPRVISDMALAAICVSATAAAVAWAGLKAARMPMKVYLPALTFPNVGNMGVPLCMFAFGTEGLVLGIAFFTVHALLQFTIGVAVAAGRVSVLLMMRNPVLWAAVLSVGLLLADAGLPRWITGTVDAIAGTVIPLMLLSLGISLSRLKPAGLKRSTIFAALRLILGFAVGHAVGVALGLEGVALAAVIIQAAMPTAVFNYLFAVQFNNQPGEVAGIVVVSTVLSFLTLPLLLGYVIPLAG
jgi:predicted permease